MPSAHRSTTHNWTLARKGAHHLVASWPQQLEKAVGDAVCGMAGGFDGPCSTDNSSGKAKDNRKNMRGLVQGKGSRSVNWPTLCTSPSNYFEVLKGGLSSSLKHIYSDSNKGIII